MSELIEASDQHWVREIEGSRHIMWDSQWQRVERVAEQLKTSHPESFRQKSVRYWFLVIRRKSREFILNIDIGKMNQKQQITSD